MKRMGMIQDVNNNNWMILDDLQEKNRTDIFGDELPSPEEYALA